jgi:4-diphosphocytidyl-2-C-methyl-D-erythritol kinase
LASANESGDAIEECASAKLNLYLHVGARRPDGYHDIDSLVVFAEFGDRVRVKPAESLELVRIGPRASDLPAVQEDDLCVRAARALGRLLGCEPAFRIALEKNIPVAAGVGGGSADAAAVLRALCRIWDADPFSSDVMGLAAALGADIPVCLMDRPARIAGTGEHVVPLPDVAPLPILLVNPGVPLATAEVFSAYRYDPGRPAAPDVLRTASADELLEMLADRRNDLDAPARECCPSVADVIAALEALPGCRLARMSGSGPTCFAAFEGVAACARAEAELRVQHPDWWVMETRTRP